MLIKKDMGNYYLIKSNCGGYVRIKGDDRLYSEITELKNTRHPREYEEVIINQE